MARLDDFINFEESKFTDVDTILEMESKTCDVYRPGSLNNNTGFGQEAGELVMIERVLAKVSRKKTISKIAENGMKFSKTYYIGITTSENVRINDVWKIGETSYKVANYDKASLGKLEVELERLE